jgi:hypothetical protein
MELSLNKSTGVARVKAAERDSPAQLVVGRALTAIEGVPVGEIRDKKSWLAVVAKLQAPERPLSLTFEAPAVSPEEPVQPVQRARAELDALAASAKAAAEQADAEAAAVASAPAPARGRQAVNRAGVRFGPRSRSPSPELTCAQCGRTGTRVDGFKSMGTRAVCSEACKAACKAESVARCLSSGRGQRPPSPPGLGERPTRRHLVAAAESAPAPQPPVESEPAAGPRPPSDAEIYDMVLAREKARIVKDYASADRLRAEMATAGLSVVYRDETGREGREAKKCGALTWSTVDGRTGPPALSTAEIESRLRAWLHARDVDQNPSRATDLLADCKARGIGTSASIWFTAQASGPLPSLVRDAPAAPPVPREAPVGLCPPDDLIRQRLVERQLAKLQRDFRRGDAIQADLARAGVHTYDVAAQVKGLVQWTTTDGRSGPKPPSDSEIYDMVLAFERAKFIDHKPPEGFQQMMAEMQVSGVAKEHLDRSGRTYGRGALRWFTIDGRTGPPRMSEREIEARLREWVRARQDNMRLSHELRADLAAHGVRVEPGQGWYTAGPNGLSGPIPSLDRNRSRSRSRSRRRRRESSRSRSRSRSQSRSRKRSRKQSKSRKATAPPAASGLDEQRPTRRHLVAAAAAPPAAPSEMSYSD